MFQVFVRLRISPPRIKLAASNFARRFVGVRGKQSHILGELCSPRSPKSDESASARVRRPKGSGSERCGGSACVDIGLGQSPLTYLCFFHSEKCTKTWRGLNNLHMIVRSWEFCRCGFHTDYYLHLLLRLWWSSVWSTSALQIELFVTWSFLWVSWSKASAPLEMHAPSMQPACREHASLVGHHLNRCRSFVRYCGQGSSLLWTPALRPR